MDKILSILGIIFVTVPLVSAAKSSSECVSKFNSEAVKRYENVSRICVTELKLFSGVNLVPDYDEDDSVDDEMENDNAPEKMTCFTNCTMETMGLFKNGVLDKKAMMQEFKRAAPSAILPALKKIVDKCAEKMEKLDAEFVLDEERMNTKELKAHKCDRVYKFHKCFMKLQQNAC